MSKCCKTLFQASQKITTIQDPVNFHNSLFDWIRGFSFLSAITEKAEHVWKGWRGERKMLTLSHLRGEEKTIQAYWHQTQSLVILTQVQRDYPLKCNELAQSNFFVSWIQFDFYSSKRTPVNIWIKKSELQGVAVSCSLAPKRQVQSSMKNQIQEGRKVKQAR